MSERIKGAREWPALRHEMLFWTKVVVEPIIDPATFSLAAPVYESYLHDDGFEGRYFIEVWTVETIVDKARLVKLEVSIWFENKNAAFNFKMFGPTKPR